MSNTENQEQVQRVEAVKAAIEWSKQVLTLATGTLVLSGTFIKEIFNTPVIKESWILACWILMSISILFGLLFIGTMVSVLSGKRGAGIDVYKHRWTSYVHVLAFFFGLICFVVFISINLINNRSPVCPSDKVNAHERR